MALEAGSLMHEMFAAVRIWQLAYVQNLHGHANAVANRIFGSKRWYRCVKEAGKLGDSGGDFRDHLIQLCYAVLNSAGWVDDPGDSTRTLSNMQLATIHYVDERLPNMENWPIYIEDETNPSCLVGIEQVFDVVLLFSDGTEIRYIGTIDGMVIQFGDSAANSRYFIDENKTAARLDTGWRNKFDLLHQVTGYCAASTTVFGFPVMNCRVTGVKIKPTNKGEDVYPLNALPRDESMFQTWGRWLHHTVSLYEQFRDDFEGAPRYTHACNRYFRPCSLIPFCCDSAEGRIEQWKDMGPADPSPSERAVMEG